MSLELFAKNLQYLKKKNNLTQRQMVWAINKILGRELKVSDDKKMNMKRMGSYLEGRTFCPAYVLPVLCKVLKHKDVMSLFTTNLEETERVSALSVKV